MSSRFLPRGWADVLRRATLVATLLIAGAAPAQEPTDAFAAATQAFAAGDFARALDLFLRARSAGERGPALEYNIAVCHYRVGDYAAAERAFDALTAEPQFRAVAQYNRGLALLAQGRTQEARAAFERALGGADAEVAALARRALASLGEPPPVTSGRTRWLGFADLAAGYDDNVALTDELPGAPATGSAFADLYGYASRRLDVPADSRVHLTGYVTRYPEADDFDQLVVRVGYALRRDVGRWRLDAGPHWSHTTLGGEGFERQLGAALDLVRGISAAAVLDIRLSYDDIADQAPQFRFIDGRRETLRLMWDRRGPVARVRLSYLLERNDRAGAAVSADRDRVTLRVSRALDANWGLDAWGSYRKSRRDRLELPVDDRLVEWSVTVNRDLDADWLLELGYYGADNDSDAPSLAYQRNRMTIGLSKAF